MGSVIVSKKGILTEENLLAFARKTEVAQSVRAEVFRLGGSTIGVNGDGSIGSVVINAANFFTHKLGAGRVIITLPLNVNKHSEMFSLKINGYAYGLLRNVSQEVSGYCFSVSKSLINTASSGASTFPVVFSVSPVGDVQIELTFASLYFLTLSIDTIRVGNGRLLKRGSILIREV